MPAAAVIIDATVPVKNSPLIAQYLSVKQQVPDAILFFRLGDFYEMFFEDAELGARLLDIQLTSRSKDGVPLCGVPHHAAEPYIAKLLKGGHKVAICEQAANDGNLRGLMPRRIVRVITPGTVGEETVLTAAEKSFLMAIAQSAEGFAIAAADVSTGEFIATQVSSLATLREEVARLAPREILIAGGNDKIESALDGLNRPITRIDQSRFDLGVEILARRFAAEAAALDNVIARVAGVVLGYIEENFGRDLNHLRAPGVYRATQYMTVDEVTRRHLELAASTDGGRSGSLLAVLDETVTPIGARALSQWLLCPLLDLAAIRDRHDAVEEFFDADLGGVLAASLSQIGDLERLAGRVGALRASPRDCMNLARALEAIVTLKQELAGFRASLIRDAAERIAVQPELSAMIVSRLGDDPPVNPREGNVVRGGFSPEVDELRALATDARGVIARLEAEERERSGISSLKIRYNRVFGYYIELTKTHLDRVPDDYERKQTLVNAERFTTARLKELERKILSAETGVKELEHQLFLKLVRDLVPHTARIIGTARAIGEIDALMSLARVARRRGYVRPEMNQGLRLWVRDGRHPVLETAMRAGEFVPNDLDADSGEHQILLITGPNMAGKSTYLRQVALIAIMAQMGSFVPAVEARLGLTDRVQTRIGARDELRRGESTFMVEMRETARLLAGLTERSLLLLDEVGRGTSTFDGLAIAWAVAEYLHDATRARVLFATHFHELTELARERPRVKNLSMAVREWGGEVLFLRRVVEGPASQSYGIEVARLAGLPSSIIARAREILSNLERGELSGGIARSTAQNKSGEAQQMGLFTPVEDHTIGELKTIDVDRLTPVDALNLLSRIVNRLRNGAS